MLFSWWLVVGVALAGLLVWGLLLEVPSFRTYRMVNRLPGPRGYPLIGSLPLLLSTPLEDSFDVIMERTKEFSGTAALWVMGVPEVIIQNPDDLQILMSSTQHIDKGIEYNLMKPWLKEGLLLSTGEKWHFRRKVLTPAFHFRVLEGSVPTMNRQARLLVDKLLRTGGAPVDLKDCISRCALDVMCEASMGINLGAQEQKSLDYVSAIKTFNDIVVHRAKNAYYHYTFLLYCTKYGRMMDRALDKLKEFTNKVIMQRKEESKHLMTKNSNEKESFYKRKKRMALLDCLLELEQTHPGSFTLSDIREEVDTFMFEGHDTVSSAIQFALFSLACNPDIQMRAAAEQEKIFGQDDRDVSLKDLQDMVYLEKVIKETLRLYPSVPYISRRLSTDITLSNGIVVPKGAMSVVMPYILHRKEGLYPDPLRFDPERFDEEQSLQRHPFAYIPFSAGPRNCIGQKFAMYELKIVLSYILRNTTVLEVTKKEDLKLLPSVILQASKPVFCRFLPK